VIETKKKRLSENVSRIKFAGLNNREDPDEEMEKKRYPTSHDT
jgi:hypothetical protein